RRAHAAHPRLRRAGLGQRRLQRRPRRHGRAGGPRPRRQLRAGARDPFPPSQPRPHQGRAGAHGLLPGDTAASAGPRARRHPPASVPRDGGAGAVSNADLAAAIAGFAALGDLAPVRAEALAAFAELSGQLNRGPARAALPAAEGWRTEVWVKQGILLGFRLGALEAHPSPAPFSFLDKGTLPTRAFSPSDKVRVVPGGTTIRDGAYLAPGVILMPPAFVNIGAYVDEGTMIDSHALVGSCAQVGRRVHLSASAQIGGVLEPVGATPVIVEDDALIGGNCGVY